MRKILILLLFVSSASYSQQQVERLNRGIVAINMDMKNVFVSWRMLGHEPDTIAFNVYRSTEGGNYSKINTKAISESTNFIDSFADLTKKNVYQVKALIGKVEETSVDTFSLAVDTIAKQYMTIPLKVPVGSTLGGLAYTYSPNDCSTADLDGDGEYEIVVKWDPSNAKDNSQSGYTGNVYIDAYKLNGKFMWRIDLGRNIRAGAHYTQLMVYDLDGDGKAEVACKTADGTIDGIGKVIGDSTKDYRNTSGYILSGPEFLTIFNGLTGAIDTTVNYIPARGNYYWGDNYGNRVDRFLACIAYLDGQRPSLVMCRGYYTRAVLAAWNWRDGKLSQVWTFDSDINGPNYAGQGNHNLSVGDVDADGKDEIIYGACAIDDNGKGLYSTGLGHGDAMHLSDIDPDRPGLEVFQCHENKPSIAGLEFRDAQTGKLLWGKASTTDVGRGVTMDIDPRYRGYEMWGASFTGVYGVKGNTIVSSRPSINFGVWWDGDLLRELLDNVSINKWNWLTGSQTNLLTPANCASNNGTKATPNLCADLFGDWREEVIWRTTDNKELRIYSTKIPTKYKMRTLMHDHIYRMSVAWQNVAYNQPTQPGFYLGDTAKADDIIVVIEPPTSSVLNSDLKIKVFPNPVSNLLNVDSDNSIGNVTLSITNSFGMEVYRGNVKQGRTLIDMSKLHTGMYICEVQNNGAKNFIKLFKR